MNPSSEWETAGIVAGVHRTASAQPPRATPQWPHPYPLWNLQLTRETSAFRETIHDS
jgi:hypothetical protein